MMRASWYFWLVSLQTYMSRIGLPGRALRAFWNHGCWSEVWLQTSSLITRMPRLCASEMNWRTSGSLPYIGLTSS